MFHLLLYHVLSPSWSLTGDHLSCLFIIPQHKETCNIVVVWKKVLSGLPDLANAPSCSIFGCSCFLLGRAEFRSVSWAFCHGYIVPPPHLLPKSPALIAPDGLCVEKERCGLLSRAWVCYYWSVHLSVTPATHLEFGDMSSLCSTAITTTLPPASVHQNPLFPVGKGKPGHWLGLQSSYPGSVRDTRSLTFPSEIRVPMDHYQGETFLTWSTPPEKQEGSD